MKSSQRVSRRGFTLIEVMMAVTILVSLVVIVWGSISVSFESRQYMTNTFDQFQRLRLAMDRMTREFSMAFIASQGNREENLPDFEENAEEIENPDTGELIKIVNTQAPQDGDPGFRDNYYVSGFVGRSNEVNFTSLAHSRTRANQRSSDQAEIGYFVRSSRRRRSDGRLVKELVRREDSTLDDDMEKGGVIYTLIDDVDEVKFEYWKPGKEGDEEDGGRWVDSWDSTKAEFRGTLPGRVKITVSVPIPNNEDRDTRTFTTQAKIMMTELLDF